MSWIDQLFGNISRGVEDATKGASTAFGNSVGNAFSQGPDWLRPINYGPVDEGKRQEVMNRGYGFSNKDQMGDLYKRSQGDYQERSNPQPFTLPAALRPRTGSPVGTGTVLAGLNNDITPDEMSENADIMSPEDQMIADTIAAIQARLSQKYSYDGKFDKMVDQAFGGALGAIDKAEGRANSNYKQSEQYIDQLTDSHVNEIETTDRGKVQGAGDSLVKGIGQNYDGGIKQIQNDRALELKDRAEAMSRYGLDPAIETVMNPDAERNAAITRLMEERAANVNQAKSNTTADLQLNTARAAAQESDGIERQGDLRRDLNQILGTLDNSRAGVQSSIAQAKLQGQQADQAAWNDSMRADADTLAMYKDDQREQTKMADERAFRERELALKQKAAGTGSAGDVAADRVRQMGVDPTPIEQAYYEVMSANDYTSLSGKDKKSHIMHEMRKRLGELDSNGLMAMGRYVDIKEGFGTDKANSVIG